MILVLVLRHSIENIIDAIWRCLIRLLVQTQELVTRAELRIEAFSLDLFSCSFVFNQFTLELSLQLFQLMLVPCRGYKKSFLTVICSVDLLHLKSKNLWYLYFQYPAII